MMRMEKIAAQAQTDIAQTSERKVYLGWKKKNKKLLNRWYRPGAIKAA